ncbi:MAG: MaoC/PaaZ C-terminal domain-containing protein [Myxococcota bacterium]
MELTRSPSLGPLYARALFARKPSLVPEGSLVARLEGSLPVRVDDGRLARYRALCGWRGDDVPPTWPHVLASGLHLAMLTSREFPVRLLGLVHLANRIEQRRALSATEAGRLVATLEGHRDTERGQEFELHTELRVGSEVPWRETSTFLARRKRTGSKVPSPPGARAAVRRTVQLEAPAGLGRRYGAVAGDLNPIHVGDLPARLFGFPRAIAHGMWSLARCAAELEVHGAGTLEAQFKLPLFLPSRPVLEVLDDGAFRLVDERREKPHLDGRWSRAT